MSENKQIFISYNWNDSEIINEIDNYFLSIGLPLIRDKKELQYKSSIKEFMKKVRKTDYVLMVISDSFIKSSNCMFEVLELVKEDNYKDKLLQILLPNAKIFNPLDKLKYIKYWDNKYKELEKKTENIETVYGGVLIKELKHIANIKGSIGEFLEFLSEENCISFEKLKSNNYKQITDFVGYKREKVNKRPKVINADVFKFKIEEKKWIVLIGLIDKKPFEIYCGLEDEWFPLYSNIDFTEDVLLIQDTLGEGADRIDLQYVNKNDGHRYTHEGMNRTIYSKEIYLYTRILISLLQSNVDLNIIINLLDEMYTQDYANPYVWKNEMKGILNQYNAQ